MTLYLIAASSLARPGRYFEVEPGRRREHLADVGHHLLLAERSQRGAGDAVLGKVRLAHTLSTEQHQSIVIGTATFGARTRRRCRA